VKKVRGLLQQHRLELVGRVKQHRLDLTNLNGVRSEVESLTADVLRIRPPAATTSTTGIVSYIYIYIYTHIYIYILVYYIYTHTHEYIRTLPPMLRRRVADCADDVLLICPPASRGFQFSI